MRFSIYLRTIKENKKLLTNKKRHGRVKERVLMDSSKRKLVYKELTQQQQSNLRKEILKDLYLNKMRQLKTTIFSLVISLLVIISIWLEFFKL